MIARKGPSGLVLLTQDDHARLTGALAEAWRWPLPRPEETARACAMHDSGWVEWDAAPRVDAEGSPHTYQNMPPDDYLDIWERGFSSAWAEGEWVGLLVSLHGSRFLERKRDRPEYARVLDEEAARRGAALRSIEDSDAERAFLLLRYLDGLSLFLCDDWDAPWSADAPGPDGGNVKVEATRWGGDGVVLDPWPFRVQEVRVEVPARHLGADRLGSDEELRRAFRDAAPSTLSWRLLAPGALP